MPLFFLHLRDGTDVLLDPDGIERSEEAIHAAALETARGCIAEDARVGRIDLNHWIDVHDRDGRVVDTVSFADAVEIVPATEAIPA